MAATPLKIKAIATAEISKEISVDFFVRKSTRDMPGATPKGKTSREISDETTKVILRKLVTNILRKKASDRNPVRNYRRKLAENF